VSWRIAQKGSKFRVWSTISDAWLTDWVERDAVTRLYHEIALLDFMEKIVEFDMRFPGQCWDRDGIKIEDEEREQAYEAWLGKSITKGHAVYVAAIDEQYREIMKRIESKEGR